MPATAQQRKGKPPDLNPDPAPGGQHTRIRLKPLWADTVPCPSDTEVDELTELLKLVSTPTTPVTVPPSPPSSPADGDRGRGEGVARRRGTRSLQWPVQPPRGSGSTYHRQSTEASALDQFSLRYQGERNFSGHAHHKLFTQIFAVLVRQRLNHLEWMEIAPPENILRLLVCLRIMMRDVTFQQEFFTLGGVKILSTHLQKATDSYLTFGDGPFVVDILKEMTNIFQKLSAVIEQRDWLVACGAHKALVLLLSANDVIVLHCTLHALIGLAQSPEPRSLIAELNSIEIILRILSDYDTLSKKLSANLLRMLCADAQAREMIKVYDGIPLLLSLLHSDSVTLLWNVVWCLVQLSEDQDTSNDIRQLGGIPLLLSLLHDRKFVSDRTAANTAAANSALPRSPSLTAEEDMWHFFTKDAKESGSQNEEMKEHQLSLKSACCAGLTELIVNYTNAQQIVQANGIYSIGLLIIPMETTSERDRRATETLQANAFRAMRFLFSMERNRRLFKRLFPPGLFEMFIDIGHYKREISAYMSLVEEINSLQSDTLDEIKENVLALNQNKEPSHYIQDYAVLELLGSGAFGSVYKVKKKSAGQSYLALKEINTLNANLGKNTKDKEKGIGEIISELTIIREQLRHPNIVRYYKTFVQQEKLFIVMELIEGAPLGEHFSSLKEKNEKFSEERIWNIFIQMVLALRYLHKEKGIVHRDLTPNNIMLGENDKVTITDFGLAKQKQQDCSKMTSVVGTILYSCPEVVQNQPYGEKADVWAVGCILYQMCQLKPPFYSNNMLSLATKIVEADYEPIPDGAYTTRVVSTVQKCITADPEKRPDIVEIAGGIADILLLHVDNMRKEQINLEKKLERERQRTQKHFYEANHNMQNYHRLFLVSQERYDKLVNLASSGGGHSMKQQQQQQQQQQQPPRPADEVEAEFSDSVYESDTSARRQQIQQDSLDADDNNGWVSDDEMACSSGSESRESSGSHYGRVLPRPPDQGTPRSRRRPRNVDPFSQALTLDIPTKSSRDSGLSSGDPSPNNSSPPSMAASVDSRVGGDSRDEQRPYRQRPNSFTGVHRSSSSNAIDSMIRRASSGGKARPNSAGKGTLTISPRKVRPISDPILQMLHALHKIIYITQLPPTLCHNPRRRIIERFKRALFAPQSTSGNLKNELKKLLSISRELIDLHFGASETQGLTRQVSRDAVRQGPKHDDPVYDTEAEEVGVTYEQLHSLLESVLVESGYYDMSPKARAGPLPLSPIGAVDIFNARQSSLGGSA